MIDESRIPLLEDLISRGQSHTEPELGAMPELPSDDHQNVEIEQDDLPDEIVATDADTDSEAGGRDELKADASLRELIIDEEIRMILDKHMDKAYEEIIRLLSHKIS